MSSRPIKLVRASGGYNLFVNDVPVVKSGTGITFDRLKAGVKTDLKQNIPENAKPFVFSTKEIAMRAAHQIGLYVLKLGSFVDSYVDYV